MPRTSKVKKVELEQKPEVPEVTKAWIEPRSISLWEGTQTRQPSQAKIEEYAEMMLDGVWNWENFPLIKIFQDGDKLYPSDGHHRIQAAIKADKREILIELHQGTLRDAIWESFSSNKFHGLALTNEDKRSRVNAILKDSEWNQQSDRAIAEHCGVSAPLVGKIRAELVQAGTVNISSERKGKDGRVQKTSNIGSKAKPEAKPKKPMPTATAAKILQNMGLIEAPEPKAKVKATSSLISLEEIAVIHPHLEKESVRRLWTESTAEIIHDLAADGIEWSECTAPEDYLEKKYKSAAKLARFNSRKALMIKEVAAILAIGEDWLNHPDWITVEHKKAADYFTAQPSFRVMAKAILAKHQAKKILDVKESPILPLISPKSSNLSEEIERLVKEFGAKAVAEAALGECELEEIQEISLELNSQLQALEGAA